MYRLFSIPALKLPGTFVLTAFLYMIKMRGYPVINAGFLSESDLSHQRSFCLHISQ